MTASNEHDPWGSLADDLGVPAGSEPAAAPEKKASEPAKKAPPKPAAVRRDPRPAPAADWGALARGLGLEPNKAPAAPAPAKPQPQPAKAVESAKVAPPAPPAAPSDRDEIARKLASGSRLWDDDEPTPQPAAKERPVREPRPPRQERPVVTREEPRAEPRPVEEVRAQRLSDNVEAGEEAERPSRSDDGDSEDDRPRRRRRGRRGGRGRARSSRDEGGRENDLPHDDSQASGGDLSDRFDDEPAVAESGTEDRSSSTDETGEEQPRRGRSRRGRGRRSRRDSDAAGERRQPQGDEEDRLGAGPSRRSDDDHDDEDLDAVSSEPTEGGDADAPDEDGEPRKKRRRRGRRGGRRRSKPRAEGEAVAGESDEDSGDEPTPTGYVGAAKSPKAEGGRRKPAEGDKNGDERRRRRRRGRGSSSEESPGSRNRGRTAFRPVSSSFSQDDEGVEYLGLDDGDDAPRAAPRRADAETDEAVAESGLDAVREVPSWVEAIGIVIASNLDARSKSPRPEPNRPPRGRSGPSR